MASQGYASESPPSYSRRPSSNEQVLAIAPDFPLAVDAIRLVQEQFPGTDAGDAWEFVQQLAALVRADVRHRREGEVEARCRTTPRRTGEDDPPSVVPEDSLMPDAA